MSQFAEFSSDKSFLQCPKCFFENPTTKTNCTRCGFSLEKICSNCLVNYSYNLEICPICNKDEKSSVKEATFNLVNQVEEKIKNKLYNDCNPLLRQIQKIGDIENFELLSQKILLAKINCTHEKAKTLINQNPFSNFESLFDELESLKSQTLILELKQEIFQAQKKSHVEKINKLIDTKKFTNAELELETLWNFSNDEALKQTLQAKIKTEKTSFYLAELKKYLEAKSIKKCEIFISELEELGEKSDAFSNLKEEVQTLKTQILPKLRKIHTLLNQKKYEQAIFKAKELLHFTENDNLNLLSLVQKAENTIKTFSELVKETDKFLQEKNYSKAAYNLQKAHSLRPDNQIILKKIELLNDKVLLLPKAKWSKNEGNFEKIFFTPDSSKIVSVDKNNCLKVFDFQTSKLICEHSQEEKINCVAFSSDGSKIAFGGKDKEVKIFDLNSGEILSTFWLPSSVLCLAFSPDDFRIACGTEERNIKIWNFETQNLVWTGWHSNSIFSVSFSSDGAKVASSSYGKEETVKVWEAETGKLIWSGNQTGKISFVSFSNDCSHVVSKSIFKFKVWETETGKLIWEGKHSGSTNFVSESSDSSKIISASDDYSLKLWNSQTGEVFWKEHHLDKVNSVIFSQDSLKVISCGNDRKVNFWDSQNGKFLCAIQNNACVDFICISTDGLKLCLLDRINNFQVFDLTFIETTKLSATTKTFSHSEPTREDFCVSCGKPLTLLDFFLTFHSKKCRKCH
ncbi:PQQ-binding-like beta-propeller repeat protein [bacterium]|nr:PQQ-binding-like beta-propeller repeat protein [bacterium]